MNLSISKMFLIILTYFILISLNFFIFNIDNDSKSFDTLDIYPKSLGIDNLIKKTRGANNQKPINERSSNENEWRMHRYGPDHQAFTSASGPTNASILWYNTTGGSTYSSPCVAAGRVFIGVGDTMKCYYENNGTLAWSMSPDNPVAGGFGVCSSPAYANGCIYFGADKIYCVWSTNGTVRWKVDKPNIKHGDGSPTLAYGRVFISGSDYKLYCINQLTGIVNWTFQAKSDYPPAIPDNWGLYAAPAVVNGSVYLAACDWYLYKINITQPTNVATANHTFKLAWASYSSPVVVGDKVYVGCSYMEKRTESRFYCLWASNLTKIWEFNPNKPSGFFSSAGYYNGQIFIGSIAGTFYCLNASSGSQVWNYTIGDTWSSPAVTNERLYIGSKSGYIYCFNTTQSGTPEYYWRYLLGGEVDTSPSIVPGRVYIGTHGNGGRLYCFGTPDSILPQVVSNYPNNDAVEIPITVEINITFNEPINPNTLTHSSFVVKDSDSNSVPGKINYDAVTRTAVFKPDSVLIRGEIYNITITTAVQDHWANPLDGNKNNAADGSPIDDYTWNFTTSINNPPMLTEAGVTPVMGDITTEFEFKVVYTDLENDPPLIAPGYLKIVIDDDTPGKVMALNASAASVLRDGKYDNGEEYVYSTTFSSYGLHKYRYVCSDGLDAIETQEYSNPLITSKPVLDTVGELDAYEDIELTLALADKIFDADSKLSELRLTVNSSYAVIDELNVTFNYPNDFNYPSGRSYDIVAINVSDSVHNVTQDVRVNVHAVNDPPKLAGMPDIQIKEDDHYYLDATPYLSDVDNELAQLTVTTNSSFATVLARNITFHYPNGSGVLYEHVEINVSDGELFDSQDILVAVIPEGMQLILLPIPDQNATEDIDLIIDMTDYIKFFAEPKIIDLVLETDSDYCTIIDTSAKLVFNYPNSFNYPSGRSYEVVQVNTTYANQTLSKTFKINVQAVNDGPNITAINPPIEAQANATILFKARYLDVDGTEEPRVSVVIDGTEHDMVLRSGELHTNGAVFELELVHSLPPGDYEYYYLADDREFNSNSVNRTIIYNLKIYPELEPSLDTDQDLIPDAWELQFGFDPNDGSDAAGDPDGDGYSNLAEYYGPDGVPGGNDSTDPHDNSEFPIFDKPAKVDNKDKMDYDQMNIMGLVLFILVILIILIMILFFVFRYRMKNPVYDHNLEYEYIHTDESPKSDGDEVIEE